jgi:hypothetical protein
MDLFLERCGTFNVIAGINEDSFVKRCTELGLLNPMGAEHLHEVVSSSIVLNHFVKGLKLRISWSVSVNFNLEDLRSSLV